MRTDRDTNSYRHDSGTWPYALIGLSLAAIAASFVLANSDIGLSSKSRGFAAIVAVYLIACGVSFLPNARAASRAADPESPDIDEHLQGMEDASRYFSGTLKTADVFRLISSRINAMVPFTSSVLYIVDRGAGTLRAAHVYGEGSDEFRSSELRIGDGPAAECLTLKRATAERSDKRVQGAAGASAMIPIMRNGDVAAVICLRSEIASAFGGRSLQTLDAVSERITPLVIGSLSFERSLSNALTDPLTALPNERAFHLILENQIAETQRNPDERPLSILAVEIFGFDEHAEEGGREAGELLAAVAGTIKGKLRQMDFFARAAGDEFLAILPTADQAVAEEVVARVVSGVSDLAGVVLNIGIASFGKDGETADQLLRAARVRRSVSADPAGANVLWFPSEAVN